jgi:outer membrane protein assembly factor BamD (BamD/ComL family)
VFIKDPIFLTATAAVAQLDRFIQLHPANKDVAYAYYIVAVSPMSKRFPSQHTC